MVDFCLIEFCFQFFDKYFIFCIYFYGYIFSELDIKVWQVFCGNCVVFFFIKCGSFVNFVCWFEFIEVMYFEIQDEIKVKDVVVKVKVVVVSKVGGFYVFNLQNIGRLIQIVKCVLDLLC